MKKELVYNFLVGQALDAEVTLLATQFINHAEKNPFINSLFGQLSPEEIIGIKGILAVIFIGGYALSTKSSGKLKLEFIMEKALTGGNYLYAGYGILNATEFAAAALIHNNLI